jgi:hypothetical protein
MPTPVSLDQIFGAFVNQGTLEEAAYWMAGLAAKDAVLAAEIRRALEDGIARAKAGEAQVAASVNKSGYRASNVDEAGEYCAELLVLFERS